jgi:hypothetical protein
MAITTSCRRCGRPLSSPLAVAAELGSRCALLDAAEAAQGAAVARDGQRVAEAAIAAVTARVHGLPVPVVDGILDDAPAGELAFLLASLTAWTIEHTDGGAEWLQRLGVAWAREAGD